VNYFYLLLALITIYACYAVRALRWRTFQAHVGQARFWNIYAMNLAGFSALFLLGRVAEPVRPLLISRKDKIPLADTFGIYALERILDACSTAALASISRRKEPALPLKKEREPPAPSSRSLRLLRFVP